MRDQNYVNQSQDHRLGILEKHIETFNKEMGDVKIATEGIRKDVCWLKKFFWIVMTASIAGLITGIIQLAIK